MDTNSLCTVFALAVTLTIPAIGDTHSAADCGSSAVAAAVAAASDGDTVSVPTGSCTWTSGITITGKGVSIIGAGAGSTVITDSVSGRLFALQPTYGNSTMRVSGFTLQPGTTSGSPILLRGTCTASGCPNVRLDHISFSGWSAGGQGLEAYALILAGNVFGVIDHNTVAGPGAGGYLEFVNVNHGSYLGVGQLGDNSWAAPNSVGTGNALYMEDNTLTGGAWATDCDHMPSLYDSSGCRMVISYNNFTAVKNSAAPAQNHGTESGGRMRGGVSMEVYGNTMTAVETVSGFLGIRSGTAMIWGNTVSTSGGASNFANLSLYRMNNSPDTDSHFWPWYTCDGTRYWDQNDNGGAAYYTGHYTGSSGSGTFVDSTANWTAHQWQGPVGSPYTLRNATQGWATEISDNTATGITTNGMPFVNWGNQGLGFVTWNNNDTYEIRRVLVCMDQPGRGGPSTLLSGDSDPVPHGWVGQTLLPVREWADTKQGSGNFNYGVVTSGSLRVVRNRDYYFEQQGQAAQSSPTSPFDGSTTIGMGHGTLANRPTTCTAGVGYWATDSGPTWKNGAQGGQLFVCGSGNTWNAAYTPHTYPHPLVSGGDTVCSITPTSLGPYTAGQTINQPFTATSCTSSTFTITAGSLTGSGLSLNGACGVAPGTGCALTGSAAAGGYGFTVGYGTQATDPLSLTINAAPSIGTSALPDGVRGQAYSQTLSTSGGTGAITCAVTSGSLPPGLTLTGCTISGTP